MRDAAVIQRLETVYAMLAPMMDERMRRQWAAAEAQAYGWGGMQSVSTATGMSPHTVRRGLRELAEREAHPEVPVSERVSLRVVFRAVGDEWLLWPTGVGAGEFVARGPSSFGAGQLARQVGAIVRSEVTPLSCLNCSTCSVSSSARRRSPLLCPPDPTRMSRASAYASRVAMRSSSRVRSAISNGMCQWE